MDFKDKYLKYKKKYITLKNQIGGTHHGETKAEPQVNNSDLIIAAENFNLTNFFHAVNKTTSENIETTTASWLQNTSNEFTSDSFANSVLFNFEFSDNDIDGKLATVYSILSNMSKILRQNSRLKNNLEKIKNNIFYYIPDRENNLSDTSNFDFYSLITGEKLNDMLKICLYLNGIDFIKNNIPRLFTTNFLGIKPADKYVILTQSVVDRIPITRRNLSNTLKKSAYLINQNVQLKERLAQITQYDERKG